MRAFLFDVDAWLSSTDVSMMTAVEERGYLRLLLHAWKQPDCGLPDDDDVLASLSLIGAGWPKAAAKIRRCFEAREGRIYNGRLLKEWEYQREYHQKQKNAANARWGNSPTDPKPQKPRHKPKDMPPHMPRHMRTDQSGKSPGNASVNTAYAVELEQKQKPKAAAAKLATATPPPLPQSQIVEIAKLLQMAMPPGTPPPITDLDLIGRVHTAMQGATMAELAAVLVAFRRLRRPPDSYGFWPLYLTDVLSPAARAKLKTLHQEPVQEVVKSAPCPRCAGSGVVGVHGARTPADVRAAVFSGSALCECEHGIGWQEYFAMDEVDDGMPVIQRRAGAQ